MEQYNNTIDEIKKQLHVLYSNMASFEHLCRVCAGTTQDRNSVAEGVHILKTPELKDKIEKFLYLKIDESDIYPKVLCKVCFRQVEATASLSTIAKHTQQVFRNYIFNSKFSSMLTQTWADALMKSSDNGAALAALASQLPTSLNSAQAIPSLPSSSTSSPDDVILITQSTDFPTNDQPVPPCTDKEGVVLGAQSMANHSLTNELEVSRAHKVESLPSAPASACTHKEDVVANVSMVNPAPRQPYRPVGTAQWLSNLQESPYIPTSIAQRAFPTSAPKRTEKTNKPAPPGIFSFHQHKRNPVKAVNNSGNTLGGVSKTQSSVSLNMPESKATLLNSKRRNLKQTLSNSKVATEGQVSLLKVSQQPAATSRPFKEIMPSFVPLHIQQPKFQQKSSSKPKTQGAKTQLQLKPKLQLEPQFTPQAQTHPEIQKYNRILAGEDDVAGDPLPEKMIIAATKQRKKSETSLLSSESEPQITSRLSSESEPQITSRLSSESEPQLTSLLSSESEPQLTSLLSSESEPQLTSLLSSESEPQLTSRLSLESEPQLMSRLSSEENPLVPDLSQSFKPNSSEDIPLGKVIKDQDLLKLILKALKWPVTEETMEMEMTRLRDSSFTRIMQDDNLLQDSDMTQLLFPYFGPVLQASQMLQQQQQLAALSVTAANSATSMSTSVTTSEGSSVYNASSEQSIKRGNDKQNVRKRKIQPHKPRKATMRDRSSTSYKRNGCEVKVNGETVHSTNSGSSHNIRLSVDPKGFLMHLRILDGSETCNTNEELLALLQRQKAAILEHQAYRQRCSSTATATQMDETELAFEADDIVLMEPDQGIVVPPNASENNVESNELNSPTSPAHAVSTEFLVPEKVSKPLITHRKLKRRKTMVQSSPACTNLALRLNQEASGVAPIAPLKDKQVSATNVATQYPSTIITTNTLAAQETLATETTKPVTSTNQNITNTQLPSSGNTTAIHAASNIAVEPMESVALATSSMMSTSPAAVQTKKDVSNKTKLGQHLLEAIGCQMDENDGKGSGTPSKQKSGRGSVQQIRSALKKSLQKAQQQQQRRKQEQPIVHIDLEDDNVNIVKEVVVQPKQKTHDSVDEQLDVEEEINKITLVLQSKTKEVTLAGEKEHAVTGAKPKIGGTRRKMACPSRKLMPNLAVTKDETCANEQKQDESPAKREKQDEASSKIDKQDECSSKIENHDEIEIIESETNPEQDNTGFVLNLASITPLQETLKDTEREKEAADAVSPRNRAASGAASPYNRASSRARKTNPEDDGGTLSVKAEGENTSNVANSRPTRASKAMSRYYKGPDARPPPRSTSISTRSTTRRS